MGRGNTLTKEEIGKIDAFKQENYSNREIANKIGRSHKVINNYVNKPENYGKNRKGCTARATTERERRSILHEASNSAATARVIKDKVGCSASIRTVRRVIQSMEEQSPYGQPALSVNTEYINHTFGNSQEEDGSHQCRCNQVLEEVTKLRSEMTALFTNLTASFIELQKDLRERKRTQITPNILDKEALPFETVEDVMEFEKKISGSPDNLEELQKEFFHRGSHDTVKFVKGNLRLIFRDEVATQFTWLGKSQRKAARSMFIIFAIKNAFLKKFPQISEETFNTIAMKHFQYAADRINKTTKNRKRKITETPTPE